MKPSLNICFNVASLSQLALLSVKLDEKSLPSNLLSVFSSNHMDKAHIACSTSSLG